jgi:formate hydrogenlyase subunit 3/multisubunit Na+/H+ antiporter MnhD subunit
MTLDMWLRVTAIALPLLGASVLWQWKNKSIAIRYWLAVIISSMVGLAALGLFLLNRHFACIFSTGKKNCLTDALATLSLILLCAVLVISSIILRDERQKLDYRLMLFLSSAWAGIGLAKNLLVLLVFLNLFFYVIYKWLDQKGLGWGMFITRNDYRDDQNHYRK